MKTAQPMATETTSIASPVGPWEIVRPLGDSSWLAQDDGRQVVIKSLDGSCLKGDKLRDGVRERLQRIRQLPQVSMANLLDVQLSATGTWSIWEHVPGQPLEQWMPQASEIEMMRMAREVILAVLQMHALGIVHGAIHGRNIIVCGRGPRLTHASPLMWTDPDLDRQAVLEMLSQCTHASLLHWVKLAGQESWSLEQLARKLMSAELTPDPSEMHLPVQRKGPYVRLKAIIATMGVLLLGSAATWGLWRWTHVSDNGMGWRVGDLRNNPSQRFASPDKSAADQANPSSATPATVETAGDHTSPSSGETSESSAQSIASSPANLQPEDKR